MHGLPFRPAPAEHAHPQEDLRKHLRDLYEAHATTQRPIVAYKGGRVEQDLLREMGLPSLDLEVFGCPKFDNMTRLTTVAS